MPGSWSDFLKLRSGPAPPPSSEAGAVRVYADANGVLRSVQSDGTDAAVGGGGGSTPYVTQILGPYTVNFDTAGVLVYPGAPLFAVGVGDWLIDAWVQVITQFQGPTLTQVLLGLTSDGANPNDFAGGGIDLVNPHESLTTDFKVEGNAASDATQRLTASRASEAFRRLVPAQARVACNVCANVYVDDGGLTAGQALISALVARA